MKHVIEEDSKQKLEFTHKYSQIIHLIERAETIQDLETFYKLLPLSDLKKLLFSKVSTLNLENSNNNHLELVNDNKRNLSLHQLYYHCMPFDIIFSDDIICSIIIFLSSPTDDNTDYMYNKLPLINKHFNKLMKQKTILYKAYCIKVSLNDDLWKKRKSVLVSISHQTKSIHILDPVATTSGVITPPFIPSNINLKYRNNKKRIHNIRFEILNLDDMNNKCPFIWWSIKKWHIISTSNANRLYSQNLYQYYNNRRVDRVNRMYYSNDFSGYVSPTDSLDLTPTYKSNRRSFFNSDNAFDSNPCINLNNDKGRSRMEILTENNSIMKQLLDKAAVHIKSIRIDDNYNMSTNNNNNNDRRALKNFFWLNKLFHVQSLSNDIISFYSIKNLCYLDLISSIHSLHSLHCKTFDILRELKQLLVIKIDLNQTYFDDSKSNDDKEWLVTFPINIEFIQILNFSNANSSNYLLNFNECKNIVAILFRNSKILQWRFHNLYAKNGHNGLIVNGYKDMEKCIIWPAVNSGKVIECVLFDDGMTETRSINNWYEYFEQQKHRIPIRYCRYRILPKIMTNHEELIEIQSNHSHDSNVATVDDDFVAPKLDLSITIRDNINNNIIVPLTPSYTDSSTTTCTVTTTGNAQNGNIWSLEKGFSGSASLDEEEEMKEKQNVHLENINNIRLPLTKDMLNRYQIFDIENIVSKIVKVNEICSNRENEEFCMILDDENNDGLLWKLLLMNKYEYCGHAAAEEDNNKFVAERVAMYKQWFAMDIAKWIYHLGYWSLFPSAQINRARHRVSLIQNLNNININTTHSQPNVARRSATINTSTSSPTVSVSPSVVDSLELYLPTNT